MVSCGGDKLPVPEPPEPPEPDERVDTTFWSSGEIKVYEGIYHRIDSSLAKVDSNGNEIFELYKEYNHFRQYLVKAQGDTIYLTFNKHALNTSAALTNDQLDAEGYYVANKFDSYKFVGDTLVIKENFRFTEYYIGRILKAKAEYVGLL